MLGIPPSLNPTRGHATEMAVDAHATRLLLDKSPPEACVDSSLGPYVTSILREQGDADDVTNDLVELLESQCQMDSEVARDVLSRIAVAVNTGEVPNSGIGAGGDSIVDSPTRRSRSKSLGAEPAYSYDANFLGKILQDTTKMNSAVCPPTVSGSYSATPFAGAQLGGIIIEEKTPTKRRSVTFDETPSIQGELKSYPQAFEPLEGILDVLDLEGEEEKEIISQQCIADQNVAGEKNESEGVGTLQDDHSFPQLEATIRNAPLVTDKGFGRCTSHSSTPQDDRKTHKSSKEEADDLAAALFRPSRPRSNSTPVHSSSAVLLSPPPPTTSHNTAAMPPAYNSSNAAGANAAEMNATVQLLLTLNSRYLGHEAAFLASQLTDGDLNLAQYLIEAARSDPSAYNSHAPGSSYRRRRSRICRHELRGVCYRADCPYNHDLSGVTCLFWLKGRCRESNCRFLHGFAESLLEGINEEYLIEQQARKEERDQRVQQQRLEEVEKKKIHNIDSPWSAGSGSNISSSYPW